MLTRVWAIPFSPLYIIGCRPFQEAWFFERSGPPCALLFLKAVGWMGRMKDFH